MEPRAIDNPLDAHASQPSAEVRAMSICDDLPGYAYLHANPSPPTQMSEPLSPFGFVGHAVIR